MTETPNKRRRHNRWLVLIALYKFAQAVLFIALGVGALRMVGKDVSDYFALLADHLRFNPEGRLTHFLLDRATLINDPVLKRIGAAAFCYAALGVAEGTGLYLEKTWGEVLTLVITASFLPWELVEVVRRVTLFRIGLLAINIGVFLYLIALVSEQRRIRHARKRQRPPHYPPA